jgi:hypothetical protein
MGARIRPFVPAAIVLCFTLWAGAAPTIDQQQGNHADVISYFFFGDLAQSFQQAHGNVAGAGIFLDASAGTGGDVTISLWDDLPDESGVQLATGTAAGTPGSWVDVYWSPVVVTPDTTLFLVFESTDDDLDGMAVSGDTSDPYSRGQAYAVTGFEPFPAYDYAFRTYYDDTLSTIPAPAALLLAGLGAGIVRCLRRRRVF